MMDRTSLTLVGGFILLIVDNFSSAGHIPWIPILCPKNSNSSLKKSDLDSLRLISIHVILGKFVRDVGGVVGGNH